MNNNAGGQPADAFLGLPGQPYFGRAENLDEPLTRRISERQWCALQFFIEAARAVSRGTTRPIDPVSWLVGFEAGTTLAPLRDVFHPQAAEVSP
jgi:hypothetical protein